MRFLIFISCVALAACTSEPAEGIGGTGGFSGNGNNDGNNDGNNGNNNNGNNNNGNNGGNNGACPDRDRDGYVDKACNARVNGQPRGGDCDDYNNLVNPGRTEDCGNQVDNNCDGQPPARDQACLAACPDQDGDGYVSSACNSNRATGGDCNDQDPTVNPGQLERCGNGKDDDCQGGDLSCRMNCQDNDQDGFGVGSGCYGPDCNDGDRTINAWASEICGDRVDQDCDREDTQCPQDCRDNDRDGFGEGAGCLAFDCNDMNPNINPGARDIPGDGIDQDCNQRDLQLPADCQDLDQDGYGQGRGCLGLDCDDNDPRVHAGRTEVCGNRRDDDCQGGDRPCVTMGQGMCMDQDGDGYGEGACPNGGFDCDERSREINPGAQESCNGVDDDCDMRTDECPHRLQVCAGNACVGSAGAPCGNDNECGPDANLYCNRDIGQCRIRDGEPCDNTEQCNPTAECTVVNACGGDSRCYQARGGQCQDGCDCTGKFVCQNNRCVECSNDAACNQGARDQCTDGGFCVEDEDLGMGGGDGPVERVCEDTCGQFETPEPWNGDGDCDDGGEGSLNGLCALGTDCEDCGPRLVPVNGGGGEQADTLVTLANLMIRCWSAHERASENQGCYELAIPERIMVNGAQQNQLGDADALYDIICENGGNWRQDNGFVGAEGEILGEIMGCGFADIINFWSQQRIVAGGGTICMYFAPAKSGFGFPAGTRAAVVIESCNISHID
jgi:hypothetical protein